MKDYNFSHTLLSCTDCMKKVEFYLNKTAQGYQPATSDGILLHKYCEQFLNKETPVPPTIGLQEKFNKIQGYLETKVAPYLKEIEVKCDRAEGDFRVTSRFDAVIRDDGWNIWLLDWKFVGKRWTNERYLDYVFKQGWLYLWAAIPEYNPIGIRYIVVSDEDPEPVIWELRAAPEELEQAVRKYKSIKANIDSAIMTNRFMPNPGPMCNWCSYKEVCPDKWVRKS